MSTKVRFAPKATFTNQDVIRRFVPGPDKFTAASLPAPKIFLQKRLSHKGYPLYGTEPVLDGFLGEGA